MTEPGRSAARFALLFPLPLFLVSAGFAPRLALAELVHRRVVFASVLGHAVINEVLTTDAYFFERCAYHHVPGLDVPIELSAHAFLACRPLGHPVPPAARAGVLKTLGEVFAARRKEMLDPNVYAWGLQGAIEGLVIGGLGYVGLRRLITPRYAPRAALNDFARFGGLVAVGIGTTRWRRALSQRGRNHALLTVFDPRVPPAAVILDQRGADRATQVRAMALYGDLFGSVLDHYAF